MIPVQIIYETKFVDGLEISEYYSISKFKPNIDLALNQALFMVII